MGFGAHLQNVRILNVNYAKDTVQLRLQTNEGALDSYFIVDVTKDDQEGFDKLSTVLKKITLGERFKLDLNIPSFSATPSGSYYKSKDISFISATEREPNSTKKKANKK